MISWKSCSWAAFSTPKIDLSGASWEQVMWKAQLLDSEHLLISLGPGHAALARASEPFAQACQPLTVAQAS